MSADQIETVEKLGLRIYRVCDKFKHILRDLIMTAGLYFGGFSTH
jgi:hypothetical protein